jgi:hypothetical protein
MSVNWMRIQTGNDPHRLELIKKKTYLHAGEQDGSKSGSGERRTSKAEKNLLGKQSNGSTLR